DPIKRRVRRARFTKLRSREAGQNRGSDQSNGPGIFADRRIGSHQRQPFYDGLSDENAVEGVSVNRRQAAQRHRMSARYWQLHIIVVVEASTKGNDVGAKNVAAPAPPD